NPRIGLDGAAGRRIHPLRQRKTRVRQASSGESGGVSRIIEGKVVSIGEQGNLVTDIPCAALAEAPRDSSVSVCCDEHETVGLFSPGHSEPEMSLLALLADSGF